jgi:hypothetical protein
MSPPPALEVSMKIRNLDVQNFRSLRETAVHLGDCTSLIGRNNTGKSNILHSIRLLLEGGKADVKETDFWDKGKPIQIRATLDGVTACLPLSEERHRSKIESFVSADRLTIAKFFGANDQDPGKIYLINPRSGKPELPTGIDAALKQILPEPIMIESLADPSDEVGMKSTTAVGKIFGKVMEAIDARTKPELERAFETANTLLNVTERGDARVDQIREIESDITRYVQMNFPDCRALVKIDLPTLEKVLAGVRIDLDDGRIDPFYMKGQGLQRVLYLGLLRTLADRVRGGNEAGLSRPFILLVEEAELFLHPTAQGQMRAALETIGTAQQVAFSTHSPVMVSPKSLGDIVLVKKNPNSKETVIPRHEDIPEADQRLLLEVTNLERGSRLFFADRVMLVEGRSDACLAEAIARRLEIRGFDPERHAFVEMGGKSRMPRFKKLLESVGQEVTVLVDLDFLWDGAGSVLENDPGLAQLCNRVERLAVDGDPELENPTTDQLKRKKKLAKFRCLKTDAQLLGLRESVIGALRTRGIFVLREGEIEEYVGLSESSKGRYLEAALNIKDGSLGINFQDELAGILSAFVG